MNEKKNCHYKYCILIDICIALIILFETVNYFFLNKLFSEGLLTFIFVIIFERVKCIYLTLFLLEVLFSIITFVFLEFFMKYPS